MDKQRAERALMADDEISLLELWEVLVRRRKTLTVVLVLCVLIGGVIALSSVEQYEYSTTVELGQIVSGDDGVKPVEPVSMAQAKLNAHYIPQAINAMRSIGEGFVGEVDVKVPRGSELLVLNSKGALTDEEVIHKLHTSITESMKSDHDVLTNDTLSAVKKEYALLESQVKDDESRVAGLKTTGADLEEKLSSFQSENSGAIYNPEAGLLQAVILNTTAIMTGERYLLDYQSRMRVIKIKLAQITPTRVESVATRAQKPLGIGRLTTLLLAVVMGLFVGVLAAFFHEFLGKARKSHAS